MSSKRLIDIVVSSFALVCLVPVLLCVALQVHRKMGSPILFRQIRSGINGKPFEMIKFRSMRDATNEQGAPLSDSERITPFGQWLRSSSLDELPELWNVLRGEMSLVGPRPLLMEYLSLYTPKQARRMEVKPGITGWAQVNGRNSISWKEKFDLDVWYVDNRNFWLDLNIIWMTLIKVVRRDDISAKDEVTMPKFEGFKNEKSK